MDAHGGGELIGETLGGRMALVARHRVIGREMIIEEKFSPKLDLFRGLRIIRRYDPRIELGGKADLVERLGRGKRSRLLGADRARQSDRANRADRADRNGAEYHGSEQPGSHCPPPVGWSEPRIPQGILIRKASCRWKS